MIILITGKPGTGKSTIIDKLVKSSFSSTPWVIAKEIRQNGERVGFKAVTSLGHEVLISHKTSIKSKTTLGNYRVDIPAVDHIYSVILDLPGLKIVDEIGNMQLSSAIFTKAVDISLKSPEKTQLIATIHLKDKRLRKHRTTKGIITLTATQANRDMMPKVITLLEKNVKIIESITLNQFKIFSRLLTAYLSKAQSVQLSKLLNNALPYIADNKVEKTKRGTYSVYGNHKEHKVSRRLKRLSCDCDLFNGRGIYKDKSGECSHIQAVKLFSGSRE